MGTSFAEISNMKRSTIIFRSVIVAGTLIMGTAALPAQSTASDRMPITTSSPEARALFEEGVVDWENLHIKKALQHWQAAIDKDPNFLLAHLYISERIIDPEQQAAELRKATALMGSATPLSRRQTLILVCRAYHGGKLSPVGPGR